MRDHTPTKIFPFPDLLLAVAFATLTQVEIWVFTLDEDYGVGLRVVAGILTLVASGALTIRRTRPWLAFWVNSLAVIGLIVAGFPSDYYQWTNLVVTYSLGAYTSGWQRWAGLPFAIGGVIFYFERFPDIGPPGLTGFVAATWLVAWLAGRMNAARIEEARLRTERDVSMELAQANEERLAMEEERNRIARELHDIVGQTVNVMVVHADAGKGAVSSDPGTAVRAFETIARTGRDAMSELDRVLAVLRRDNIAQDLTATPSLDDLDRLVTSFSDTGLDITMNVAGDTNHVPSSVGLAAYRIVQECLTNALKHASASHVEAAVEVGAGRMDISVIDDGHGRPDDIQPGRGVIGMRERAELHGGGLSFTTNRGRFEVAASLSWEADE